MNVNLTDAQLDALADRIAARLKAPPVESAGFVDAQQLAVYLGVARKFVYAHSDELGGRRLTPRGRIRFDLATAAAAFAARGPDPGPAVSRRSRRASAGAGEILRVRH
jgi:hypothetical protein